LTPEQPGQVAGDCHIVDPDDVGSVLQGEGDVGNHSMEITLARDRDQHRPPQLTKLLGVGYDL
jgi:hypothetical protein